MGLRKCTYLLHVQNALANFSHRAISSHIFEVNQDDAVCQYLKVRNRIDTSVGSPIDIKLDLDVRGIGVLKQVIKEIDRSDSHEFKIVIMIAKGNGLFLAQFVQDVPPYDTLEHITQWAKDLGFIGVQIPADDKRMIDLDKAAESKQYCDDLKGRCNGLAITELATHLIGQLIAVHPAYDVQFDAFAPKELHGHPQQRTEWAVTRMIKAMQASHNLGLHVVPTFSGAFLWHTMYPWPQRPSGLVELGFQELAKRWQPLLDKAEEYDVDLAYEIHPGEDLHDGVTFERFLEATGNHPRVHILYDPSHFVLQCLDYIGYLDCYKDHIKAFHVKDAEYHPSPRSGVYGGYQDWKDRPGRFRSTGDGQVDFKRIFSKLTQHGYTGWAVLEWECCVKDSVQGAREGAEYIRSMLIDVPSRAFDDFAGGAQDSETNYRILGLQT